MRLDKFLSLKYRLSRQHVQRLIRENRVLVAGKPVKKDYQVREDDTIQVDWPAPQKSEISAEKIPLEMLYQDEDLAVINKPAGLVSHPYGRVTSGTLVNALFYHLKNLSAIGGTLRPGIVHRLDRETSGLMVIAKNDFSHRFLCEEFSSRRVEKRYLAFVKGRVPWTEQEVALPLTHSRNAWTNIKVGFRKGRESLTRIRVKRVFPSASLVEVFPRTGRTHQIRVVLDFLGFPIIGDRRYGEHSPLDDLISRQALHAAGLSFHHPRKGNFLTFSAPLPGDLVELERNLTNIKI